MNDDEPKKRGRKPVTDGTNKVMVTFRVSPDMKSWLDECAAKGAVKAEIFDLALELARYWIDLRTTEINSIATAQRLIEIGMGMNSDNGNDGNA